MDAQCDDSLEATLAAIEREGAVEFIDDQKCFSPGDRLSWRFTDTIFASKARSPGFEFMAGIL